MATPMDATGATARATAFTAEEQAAMRREVAEACEVITIDKDNLQIHFKISTKGKDVEWAPMPCKKCNKPVFLHLEECTVRGKIPKAKATFYNCAMRANETIREETHWAIIESGFKVQDNKHEKEIDFPKWVEGTSWEQYRKEISYYREATTRKPINQLMEMNRALKESGKVEMANRLYTEMEEFKNDDDIIEKCVAWVTSTYGKTKYEEQVIIGERLKAITRDLNKDMQVKPLPGGYFFSKSMSVTLEFVHYGLRSRIMENFFRFELNSLRQINLKFCLLIIFYDLKRFHYLVISQPILIFRMSKQVRMLPGTD